MEFLQHIRQYPVPLQLWVAWLAAVNCASVLFLRQREARWVLAAWLANIVLMNVLFARYGFSRLLGISHVLFWTPLLAYLLSARRAWIPAREGRPVAFAAWLLALIASNGLSLAIDVVDVARYFLGG